MANTVINPTIFAKEVVRNRDKKNVFMNFVNSAFTGELKKAGDTVTVQTLPTLSFVTGGTAGDAISATDFTITSENLVIDKVGQLRVTLKDIEMTQSNLSLESAVAGRFADAEAQNMDGFIRDTILVHGLAKIPEANKLYFAAPKSDVSKTTIFGYIEEMRVALYNQNVSDNLVLFVTPLVASYLLQSGLLDGTDAGWTVRQKGAIGMLSGVKVVQTTALTATKEMIMMQEGAVNCVVQLNQYDVRKGTDGFYENLIAEIIYGSAIFGENGKAISVFYIA